MKSTSNINRYLVLTAATAFISASVLAGPGPAGGNWPPHYHRQVKSKAEAEECCLPGEKVAMACKDCKTVKEKSGEDKKGVLSWFSAEEKHDCPGCGGKMSLKTPGSGKAGATSEYTHVCTKCGDDSAFTCATHHKS